jgi:hypothetical protein
MRKRPKYKVGDILEGWIIKYDGSMPCWNFLVVGIGAERYPNGKLLYFYDIKTFDNQPPSTIECDIIDMKPGKYPNCKAGWRRVG